MRPRQIYFPHGLEVPSPLILSDLFNKYNVEFHCMDFKDVLPLIKKDDFIYLDPPYIPLEESTSFTKYKAEDFDEYRHVDLLNFCRELNEREIAFVQSNSYTEKTKDMYKDFNNDTIECRRRINCKNPESKINEVIIWNKFD